MNTKQPFLQMKDISKSFGSNTANDSISLEVQSGEIHALLGENGAGKSTLMNILYGLYKADKGDIYIDNKKVNITSPKVATHEGIGMVHQHFMLIENMTALENVMLGIDHAHKPLLDVENTRNKFNHLVEKYGLIVDPDMPVWQLSVGKQQWLEIIKLLFRDVKLLILDEPTAVLTPSEVKQLFVTLKNLSAEGRSIIFITHKLDEVKQIADRITVLRDGKLVGTLKREELNLQQLSQMMVGRSVSLERRSRARLTEKKPALMISNLHCKNDRNLEILKSINLTVNTGEIVGIAGVDGNGQKELAECIAGTRMPVSGEVSILGKRVIKTLADPQMFGFIPEDRHKTGLILDFTIFENLIIKTFGSSAFCRRGVINWEAVKSHAEELIETYDVRATNSSEKVKTLSGGNQQKVVVARETNAKPTVILAAQPTRGLDLGAIESLHSLLLKERNRGAAVLLISTELSEITALSDRIMVMFNGEIMGEMDGDNADVIKIGEMMMGHRDEYHEN